MVKRTLQRHSRVAELGFEVVLLGLEVLLLLHGIGKVLVEHTARDVVAVNHLSHIHHRVVGFHYTLFVGLNIYLSGLMIQ